MRALPTVDHIADDGMADICHMYAYLMGAAGFKAASDMAVAAVVCQRLIMGDGRTGIFDVYRLALSV